jgi:hypothetical protein
MFANLNQVDAVRVGRDQVWMRPWIFVLLAFLCVSCDILGIGGTSTAPCGEQMEGNWEVEEGIDSQALELEWEGFKRVSVSGELRGDRRVVSYFVSVDEACPSHHPQFDFFVKVDKDVASSVDVRLVVDWLFLYQNIFETSSRKEVGFDMQLEGSGNVGLKNAFQQNEAWFFATLEVSFPTTGAEQTDGAFFERNFEVVSMRAFWRKYKPPDSDSE